MSKKVEERGNVILITIDSLRDDHLSCYGYEKETSPNIDKLAERGILFKQAISNGGHTRNAFPALFTSTYFFSYKFLKKTKEGFTIHLFDDRPYLPEILKRNGYKTAGFHSNPFLTNRYGYGRGFDVLYDPLEKKNDTGKGNYIKSFVRNHLEPNGLPFRLLKLIHNRLTSKDAEPPFTRGEEITKNALFWISNNKNSPFFVWVHYMDVHHPYLPPKKHLMKFSDNVIPAREARTLHTKMLKNPDSISNTDIKKLIDLYDGSINYADYCIGNFLSTIEDMNVLDNSLIILTADHGDAFGEHGEFGHGERKANLYDEIIHIPLIIQTLKVKENTIVERQADLLDIAPTILDFLSIQKPSEMEGNSLLGTLIGKYKKQAIFSESLDLRGGGSAYLDEKHFGGGYKNEFNLIKRKGTISCRTENWKYIHSVNVPCELYNLQTDPKEKKNIIDEQVEKAEEFKSKILQHIAMDEKIMEKLKERSKIKNKIKELKDRRRI